MSTSDGTHAASAHSSDAALSLDGVSTSDGTHAASAHSSDAAFVLTIVFSASISAMALLNTSLRSIVLSGCGVGSRGGRRCGGVCSAVGGGSSGGSVIFVGAGNSGGSVILSVGGGNGDGVCGWVSSSGVCCRR